MSVIIGDTDPNGITLGADAALGQAGNEQVNEVYTNMLPKVFRRGPYLLGVAGSVKVNQILRFQGTLPDPPTPPDIEEFLVRELIPAIHQIVIDAGLKGTDTSAFPVTTSILLACENQLFGIATDLSFIRAESFFAAGTGRHAANGALHALRMAGITPARRRIELALQAAAALTGNVRPPWQFISTDKP